MIQQFKRELILAVVLTTVLFAAADILGDFAFAPSPGELTLSAELMVLSMAVLILPALLGTIPSGYLIAKKTADIKPIIFIPALGAAIGAIILMLFSFVSFILTPDSVLQAQMAKVSDYGIDFFTNMSLPEYRSMLMFSIAFGAVFLGLMNFAIGLAGGFVGSRIAAVKK